MAGKNVIEYRAGWAGVDRDAGVYSDYDPLAHHAHTADARSRYGLCGRMAGTALRGQRRSKRAPLADLTATNSASGTGANLTSDAHLAALAIEHGYAVYSTDHDFKRFSAVKHVNPLD